MAAYILIYTFILKPSPESSSRSRNKQPKALILKTRANKADLTEVFHIIANNPVDIAHHEP